MRKKIIRRKTPKKNTGVSKKVKQYVKRLTKTPNRPMVADELVVEKLVTVGQLYYSDAFMNYSTIPNRDTRRCQSSGVKIKYIVLSQSTTTPLLVRFLVLECLRGGDYSDYKSTIVSANLSSSAPELFEDGVNTGFLDIDIAFSTTSNASNMLRRINKENYKVHRDFTVNLGTSAADRANFSQGTLWVPFKRLVTYDTIDGGATELDPVNTKLVLLAIPHEVPQDPAVPPTQQVEISTCASWYFRA